MTTSLATIARLIEATDQQHGVPPDIRHCLDQVAAEVRELADACRRLVQPNCDSTPSTGNGSTSGTERIRDGLIGDPATLRTTLDRSAGFAEGVFSPVSVQPRKREPDIARLTGQEQRILRLIAEGCTNRQIANELFLAEKTVKNYVSNLLRKLGMESRTQAAVFAARHGGLSMAVPAPASVA